MSARGGGEQARLDALVADAAEAWLAAPADARRYERLLLAVATRAGARRSAQADAPGAAAGADPDRSDRADLGDDDAEVPADVDVEPVRTALGDPGDPRAALDRLRRGG